MNFTTIKQKIVNGDMSENALRFLLGCNGECEWLDFKQELHLDTNHGISCFAKDVVAMKNTGGGYLVIGIQDKTWHPIGLDKQLPYDTKMLREKVRKATGLEMEVDIVHHQLSINGHNYILALILVRSSMKFSKMRTPSVISKDFSVREKYGIRKGDIYIRKGDSTEKITSQEELDQVINDLISLVDDFEVASQSSQSPFFIENEHFRLLDKGFEKFIGREAIRKDLIKLLETDPRIWIVNIYGPGGVGKSALASWIAYDLYDRRSFDSIIQLTAKNEQLTSEGIIPMQQSLYSLENLFDHVIYVFFKEKVSSIGEKQELVMDIFKSWSVLLVLDNMETVTDSRIMNFIADMPPDSKAKVLMTSRMRNDYWERGFHVNEFTQAETKEFISLKCAELKIDSTELHKHVVKIHQSTGGLPLAINWLIGRYSVCSDINKAIVSVSSSSSPVLDFSFQSSWKELSEDAKRILATMTIFDNPPTFMQLSITTQYPTDRIEKALEELRAATLVSASYHSSTGKTTYIALPITLDFAKLQLRHMGRFEVECRQRFNDYEDQIAVSNDLIEGQKAFFKKWGLSDECDRKAVAICRKGDVELSFGNTDTAELLYTEAVKIAPQCAPVWALKASYELNRNRIGLAHEAINEAINRAPKSKISFCFIIQARIYGSERNWDGKIKSLKKAIEFSPNDNVVRHQYGVALSKNGQYQAAIEQFDMIISDEMKRQYPTQTLMMALQTRMLNYKKMNQTEKLTNDVQLLKKLINDHPYLESDIEHFRQFIQQ